MSTTTKRTALVDADILIYKAALVAEYTVYVDPEVGVAWRRKNLVPDEARDRLHSLPVIESPQLAVDAFRSMLGLCIQKTRASHVTLFLSPSKTFRHRIAKTLPYKGNRSERVKPMYFDLIRNMMIAEYSAIVCDDIEADDGMGIMQAAISERSGESSVICSIDKDLKMIPGDHYNLTSHDQEIISRRAANNQFCIQMLTGDMTDNIQGLTRVGIKTAEKILLNVESKDRKKLIVERYKKQFKENGENRFNENFKLLRILTKVPKDQKLSFYDKQVIYTDLNLITSDDRDAGFRTK